MVTKVASNVRTWDPSDPEKKKPDPRVEYVADVDNLRYWLHRDNTLKCYVFDEAIKHAYKRTPMARIQVSLIQVITEISKGHGRGIVIAQDPSMVDKDLLNPIWCRALFIKKGYYKRTELEMTTFPWSLIPGGGHREFSGIPPTSVKFDPYEEAEFSEGGDSPMMRNPEFRVFYRYMVQKETMDHIAKDMCEHREQIEELGLKNVDATSIRRIIRRVGIAFLSHSRSNAVEVTRILEKDNEKPKIP